MDLLLLPILSRVKNLKPLDVKQVSRSVLGLVDVPSASQPPPSGTALALWTMDFLLERNVMSRDLVLATLQEFSKDIPVIEESIMAVLDSGPKENGSPVQQMPSYQLGIMDDRFVFLTNRETVFELSTGDNIEDPRASGRYWEHELRLINLTTLVVVRYSEAKRGGLVTDPAKIEIGGSRG